MGVGLLGAPVDATHAQAAPGGGTVAFKEATGGNEWWVQVAVTASGTTVSKVEVMDDGGAWATMAAHPEWGTGVYALGYHVEAGHKVTFRATTPSGTVTSCPFAHPAATEQCGGGGGGTTGTFDATFKAVRGNQYWIQAQVLPNAGSTLAKVEMTPDGGATWKPLTKQSWGTSMYAASYTLPQGTVVQLRATSGAGATDLSACYQWIPAKDVDATQVACTTQPAKREWHGYFAEQSNGVIGDMSIGDADHDGKTELYFTNVTGIRRHTATATTRVSSVGGALTVADGDNDGQAELYVTGSTADGRATLRRVAWTGSAWTESVLFTDVPYAYLAAVTVGDVDNDGLREVYVARSMASATSVLRVAKASGTWSGAVVVDIGDDGKFLDPNALWIGDGDADGKLELFVLMQGYGYGSVEMVEKGTAGWTHADVGGWGGASTYGVVAGDIDGDGKGEVAAIDDLGALHVWRFASGAWVETEMAAVDGFGLDLFLGDGDNDGARELYASTYEGGLYRLVVRNGAVSNTTTLASFSAADGYRGAYSLVVGDGDGDGRREVYAEVYNDWRDTGTIYRSQYEAVPTFTFSQEKGNDYWLEVRITSNYPVYAVMAVFNCDTTHDPADLSYRADIGKWVLGNTYIPSGTKVTFQAWGEFGGGTSQGFIHPTGTPTTGC